MALCHIQLDIHLLKGEVHGFPNPHILLAYRLLLGKTNRTKKNASKILIFAEVRAFQSWKFQQPIKTQISNQGYFPTVDDVIWGVFAKLVYFLG